MTVPGIDVSEHNGDIDWPQVAGSGVRFVFQKVNEGDYIDHRFSAARVKAAKRAGLLIGGYDFLRPRPGRTGADEFDIFYEHAKAAGLLDKGCLRPVADIEATGFSGPAAAWRTRRYIKSWVAQCVKRTGHHPIIYTSAWFYDGVIHGRDTFGCKLWVAAYGVNDPRKSIPSAWRGHASFWQYTDKATVPGITGRIDANTYLSSMAALKRHLLG